MPAPSLEHSHPGVPQRHSQIFSTDYPFLQPTGEEITAFLDEFSSDAERDKFSSANAAALFGLSPPLTGNPSITG